MISVEDFVWHQKYMRKILHLRDIPILYVLEAGIPFHQSVNNSVFQFLIRLEDVEFEVINPLTNLLGKAIYK